MIIDSGLAMFIMVMKVRAQLIRTHPHIDKAPPYDAGDSEKTFDLRSDHLLSTCDVVFQHNNYPKFCIGFKIRKSRSEQLLLSGSGHSK